MSTKPAPFNAGRECACNILHAMYDDNVGGMGKGEGRGELARATSIHTVVPTVFQAV
jgi:hypothetical protein